MCGEAAKKTPHFIEKIQIVHAFENREGPMDFREAEQQFKDLDKRVRAGKISPEQYRAALAQLRVMDASGAIWQIQERTGAWFVFVQGQWVASTPPGLQPSGELFPPQVQKAGPARRKPFALVGGIVVVIAVLAVGMVLLLKPLMVTPGGTASQLAAASPQPGAPAQAGGSTFTQYKTTSVQAGSGPVKDDAGVALQVPAGAADVPAQLAAFTLSGDLAQNLGDTFKVETAFYAVSIQGQAEGAGGADLSFPAPSPDSRLLAVIDQQYAFLLAETPQDGKLVTSARLGSAERAKSASIYYAVVTPKKSSAPPPVTLASSHLAQADTGKDCAPPTSDNWYHPQRCRSNQDGSIILVWPFKSDISYIDADGMVSSISATVGQYANSLHFSGANFTPAKPLIVVITPNETTPTYASSNGVIYLPLEKNLNLGTSNKDLWHEMAHLIQNKAYNMFVAGNVAARRWWMEVSAENMVMLLDSSYVKSNLDFYGSATNLNSPAFVFQSTPYQFPCEGVLGSGLGYRGGCADYYIQAQLVKVNMCDSAACPISQDSFVQAINTGTFPFENAEAQQKLSSNLEDYARYLLGKSPQNSNSAIPLDGVKNQDKYGEQLTVTQSTKSNFTFVEEVKSPQVTAKTVMGVDGRSIDAALEKDGVYPLQVVSGRNGRFPGLAAALIIDAGVPFYYRLDDGDLQYSDGSKEVTIAPIHVNLGIKVVRLVAWSKNGGQNFKARIEPVDLKGAWVIQLGKQVSSSLQCGDPGSSGIEPNNVVLAAANYYPLFMAMGDMEPVKDATGLEWSLVAARLPEGTKESDFAFESLANLEPDDIQAQGKFTLPQKTSQRPLPFEPSSLALVVLLPAAWLKRLSNPKSRRWLSLGLVFLLLAILLSGCMGLYGTVGAQFKLTGLEYKGGEEKATWTLGSPLDTTKPIWSITKGTVTYDMNLTMEADSQKDLLGNPVKTTVVCSGPVTYEVTGAIYPDLTIVIPKSN